MIEFDIRPLARPVPAEQQAAILDAPEFDKVFTDHMVYDPLDRRGRLA
jgi:hypothetical protein